MQYPAQLIPREEEVILLSDKVVRLPKATPVFDEWSGKPIADTYGGKAVLNVNNQPAFAELAILKLFHDDGWQGVWVDTYRNKYRVGYWSENSIVTLPSEQVQLLENIYTAIGARKGCFDVFCWKEGEVIFAESKRHKRDSIRDTQRNWLEAALTKGLAIESFLIVEWTKKSPASPSEADPSGSVIG